MTFGEFDRFLESKRRVQKAELQRQANFDYILGDLIGRSIARIYNSSNEYPEIYEVYPEIFEKEKIEEARQERTLELSALRLKEFATSFNKNKKLKEGEK